MKVEKRTGQRQTLANAGSLGSIAVDCCFVYFADLQQGTISKVSTLGGRSYLLAGSDQDFQDGQDLAVRPGNADVFWLGVRTPGVRKTSNSFGGMVTQLTRQSTGSHSGLTLVDGAIYYHDTYRIWRLTHLADHPELVTNSSDPIGAMLTDETHLYWTAAQTSGNNQTGQVYKIDRQATERDLTASP